MAIYEYRALDKTGKNIKGTIDSENKRAAKLKLKKQGIYVTDIKDKTALKKKVKKGSSESLNRRTVPVEDLSNMTRQLATLLKANVPLVDSLSAVSEQTENPHLAEALADVKNNVNEGAQLYKSMQKYPGMFDKIYVSMCEAGETSGTLEEILLRLAVFKEDQAELNARVKSALVYPFILVGMSILLLIGLFSYVIPQMVEIFNAFPELELPWYTVLVIDTSDFIVDYWMVLFLLSGGSYFLFMSWKRTPSGSDSWDAILLKLPYFGNIVRMIAVSRFARTLATLLNGGVDMLKALEIVRNVANNAVIARAIDGARNNISEGESIAKPLKTSGQFPPLLIHMIGIGEKTGDLENMLEQVSDAYDFQVRNKVDGITAIINPIMLIFMAGIVMLIVVSILLPMFDMMNNIE